MYHVTCDGSPLLDWQDDDLFLVDPKVKLEVNTVGEGSFTIYKNHPHFDKLKKLKSIFEVTDDNGVIFRGRATGDTTNFDHGMFVDLEGAMAFFNDSIVRSFNFPDDFLQDANYTAAANSGNVVAFFLGWLIDNHNAQVQDFQKMKLGTVTVTDPNNYLSRSSDEYASTWEVLKAKLFDSALGGYLCIRYEADGNYIDYLSGFTETNSQEIAYGENMLDLKRETEASEIYSAIIPIGVIGLTVAGLADRDVTDDIVKRGDTLYSKKAVEEYGWIYAPVSETTWEDVTDDANLLTKGAEWLADRGACLRALEATAVDLHFADAQVESLRIYKNVNVRSTPHDVSEVFPLSKLEIDLLHPQNTKITVGKTLMPLTERTALLQEEAKKKYSKLSKTDDEIRLEVQDLNEGLGHTLTLDKNGMVVTSADGEAVTISGGQVDAKTIKAEELDASKIKASDLQLSGVLTFGDLSGTENVASKSDIPTKTSQLTNNSGFAYTSQIPTESQITTITHNAVTTANIYAHQIVSGSLAAAALNLDGLLKLNFGGATYGYVGVNTTKGGPVLSDSTMNVFFVTTGNAAKMSYQEVNMIWVASGGCYSSATMQVYSDQRMKNSVSYDMEGEEKLFASLKPCSFLMNNDEAEKKHWGFIAQDVIRGAEDAGMDADKLAAIGNYEDMNTLAYSEFTALNTYMIQKLMARVSALEERIAELEKQ